ncbi:adhesion exoprotein [Secundilactobacillus pentosiphilus]|uniref:Adhesion exoprotein n=1 Tax=Secundilactobacillus pentosiphilus TaxID=1714682 RepID=A0A1Z5IRS3_9LACO|nr:MBG domain-containing protein [Secundilactobacillus pentosiphilus]GAX04430.1 adhesion exoprotein [Secundilactobacillus pentosiphilus]
MTNRQVKLFNEARTARKEHKKMYKSGGVWTFATIILVSGALWAAPAVTAKADAATTQNSAVEKPVDNSAGGQASASNASDGNSQNSATDGTLNQPVTDVAQSSSTSDVAVPKASINTTNTANSASVNPVNTANGSTASSQITTANLNQTNPANLNADGSISATDKTNVSLISPSDVQANFKAEQSVKSPTTNQVTTTDVTNTMTNGGVTLVPKNQSYTAGTLVFKNQIDTSKPFTINATFTTENESQDGSSSDGGGLGFILQPVDPQSAGVGTGSDPTADIGIAGQPNTTFIGRDGYKSPDSKYGDTQWNQLAVRQTDSTGQLTANTPTWMSAAHSPLGWGWFGEQVAKTEYVTLDWAPQTGVSNHQVSGVLTYSSFADPDRKNLIQSLAAGAGSSNWLGSFLFGSKPQVTLNQSVSIAAFGAVGSVGTGSNERTVTIENATGQSAFTATVNTVPIQINYLSQEGTTVLHAPDVTNVNVGDTLSIDKMTNLKTNTFAPRVIDGYQFVEAVTSEGTNSLSVSNNVLNAATQNNQINNINVYYTNQVHYTIQPVDAQGQAIPGLAPQQMTSTIGAQVKPPLETNYTATSTSIIAPGSDGSVVNVIYAINVGHLTVTYNGLPTPPKAVSLAGTVGSTYNIATPVIAGYTADLASVQGTYTNGATNLSVHYTPSSNTYVIIPVDDTGKTISSLPVTRTTSITGQKLTEPTYAGYTLAETLPITQAGQDSYQLHYAANQYQVTVTFAGLPAELTPAAENISGTTGENYQINSPVVAGYTPDQSTITGAFGPDTALNGHFVVNYKADTKDYKVQPVDGNQNPILTLTPQQFNGQTGASIIYPSYAGYTAQPNHETVPAVADETPVINVRYTANPSTVTINFAGLPTELPAITQTGVTDGTYQISAPVIAGYTPDKSILTGTYSNQGSSNLTITYAANNNAYTITPVDENGNAIAGLSQLSGVAKTNSVVATPDFSAEGYDDVAGQPALVITPDDNHFQVKYRSQIQTVIVNYRLPEGQTLPAQKVTGKIGEAYAIVSPTILGYTADTPVIMGTYGNQNMTYTVTYRPVAVTITVQYAGLDAATASHYPTQTLTGNYGDQFKFNAESIPGYTPDLPAISGVYSMDNGANMYTIKYTGKPATVTINYLGANATILKSVTLPGVVGGSYTQTSPALRGFTPDATVIAGTFTAQNATDATNNMPITVNYSRDSSLVAYQLVPVDANDQPITGVPGIEIIDGFAKPGTILDLPDYTSLGFVTTQKPVTVTADTSVSGVQQFKVTYQKQVSYTMQAVDTNNQPIANLATVTATGFAGAAITPISVPGYNVVAHAYTVPDTATPAQPIQIQYAPKAVTVTVVPVDGNGNLITSLTPIKVTQTGGTQLDESKLAQMGYQLEQHGAINVPISDTAITVPLTYLKEVQLGLTGSVTQTYTGEAQPIDAAQYAVTLPDGTRYALKASGIELVPTDSTNGHTAKNVGAYQVRLTDSGKSAIANALAQNYAVSFNNDAKGSFIIVPQALTAAPANTALVPVNAADPARNPQLPTAIVVQGKSKAYDDQPETDPTTFNVLVPSQFTDFTVPTTLDASDFDTSMIKQGVGSYQVTLKASGLEKLQQANPNYSFDASNVQAGLFVISPAQTQFRIAIDATSRVYGQQPASDQTVYPVTISGASLNQPRWTPADFVSSNTADAVGTYTVNLSAAGWKKLQAANPNYVVTPVLGTVKLGVLNIKPVSLKDADLGSIQVGDQTKVYDGKTVDPTAYQVTLPSQLTAPVWTAGDFERQNTSEAAGSYAVTLSQLGLTALQGANPNYVISTADIKPGHLLITQAPVTITAPSGLSKVADGKPYSGPAAGEVSGKPVNGDQVVYQLNYGDNGNVGPHLISVTADPKLNPNYEIKTIAESYQILPQPVIVTPSEPANPAQNQLLDEQQHKEAVDEPAFRDLQLNGGPNQTMAKVLKQELDWAKKIASAASTRTELAMTNQTGVSAKRNSREQPRIINAKQNQLRKAPAVMQVNVKPVTSKLARQTIQNGQPSSLSQRAMNPQTKKTAAQNKLPQTSDQQASWLVVLGVTLMSLLGLLGVKKRRSDR